MFKIKRDYIRCTEPDLDADHLRAPLKIHISSFPRKRESSLIKHLDPHFRGDDGIFRDALKKKFRSP
jgi:hypothetical protein